MSSQPLIRVLSDLHLGHPASLVRDISQIEPLLDGAERIVFNGDTVELRVTGFRAAGRGYLEAIEDLCTRQGSSPCFINGNHDPDASELNHLDLMNGRLLVTHGHVLFPEITPWGREAHLLRENHMQALQEISAGTPLRLEERLEAVRLACLRTVAERFRPPRNRLQWFAGVLAEMLHPWRPLQVFRAWATGPTLAERLAVAHRPEAECIAIGHTHLPGFWKRGDRLVINTGSYLPGFGRRMVEISENLLLVRAVTCDGKVFRPGRELLRRPLGRSRGGSLPEGSIQGDPKSLPRSLVSPAAASKKH